MRNRDIPAIFKTFQIPSYAAMDAAVAIPTVKGKWYMKYGEHAYYFMNFRTLEESLGTD